MRVGDDRSSSEMLVDLHVYVVPRNLWQEPLHSASNEIISRTVSAGFLRVHPETVIITLRDEIPKQFAESGMELVPNEYVFLKSVGRCLTRVKAKQEREMKVKHFLPPHAYCPEIFLLEPTQAMRNLMLSEEASSRQSYNSQQGHLSHGVYSKSPRQLEQDSSRSHHQMGHVDSGFGTYSGQHDVAMESPKRSNRTHFDDSATSDDDPNQYPKSSQSGSKFDQRKNSPTKGSPDQTGSKRSHYHDSSRSQKGQIENGIDSHYIRRGSHGSPDNENHRDYIALGRDGNRIGAGGEYYSPDGKGSRQSGLAERPGSDVMREMTGNSDEEFAEQLGARKESTTPVPLSEQHRILSEKLAKIRQERKNLETKREEMVKKAKYLQSKTTSRRNQARDVWKKRYFEEKKKTPPLEEKANRLRMDLENLHRKIVGQMEGANTKVPRSEKVLQPSQQNNMRINATKLNHEIEELQRRVDDAKMKLTGEMKLRSQAEGELRGLREELTQRKINVTLSRSQKLDTIKMDQDLYQRRNSGPSPDFDSM